MREPAKIGTIAVVGVLILPMALIGMLCIAWCLAWGHLGRIICDAGVKQ